MQKKTFRKHCDDGLKSFIQKQQKHKNEQNTKYLGQRSLEIASDKSDLEFNMAKVKQSDRHSPEKVIKCKYARHFQTSKSEALAMEELKLY